jgi:hypothetical protein
VTLLMPLFQAVQPTAGDVCFSNQALAVVTALLMAVTGSLGIMFKAYQSAVEARLADMLGQCASKDREIEYWRSSSERNLQSTEAAAGALRLERSHRG